MPPNEHPQAILGIGNVPYGVNDPLLGDVHGMVHQVEEDFVFALKMMVKPALTEL